MTPEDEKDFDLFMEGLLFYAQLSAEDHLNRSESLKEDAFCGIRHPSGNGDMFCTHEGFQALRSFVERRISEQSDADRFDSDEVLSCVREQVAAAVFTAAKSGEEVGAAFELLIENLVKEARSAHKQRRYHFPCVLVGSRSAQQITIGPVRLSTLAAFDDYVDQRIKEGKQVASEINGTEFKQYIAEFGNVASVIVPEMAESVARQRAEVATKAAINIVRMWFGLGHGRRLRIVHTEPATSNNTKYAVEDDLNLSMNWTRTSESAAVADDWIDQANRELAGHQRISAWLLRDILYNEHSEYSPRLVDALSWFGDAAFEPSPGAKIVKLVAMLERLTTSQDSSKRRFCKLVALLTEDENQSLEQRYWTAYDFYNARSEVVHGAESQASVGYWGQLRAAQEMLVAALFRAFEIYALTRFPDNRRPSTMQGYFCQHETRLIGRIRHLEQEFKSREDARKLSRKRPV